MQQGTNKDSDMDEMNAGAILKEHIGTWCLFTRLTTFSSSFFFYIGETRKLYLKSY